MIDIEYSPKTGDCKACGQSYPVLNVLVIQSSPNLRYAHALCENCLNSLPDIILQKCMSTPPHDIFDKLSPETQKLIKS